MNITLIISVLDGVVVSVGVVAVIVASAVGFFLLVKFIKWVRVGNVNTLDQRITSYMPQNYYGKYRSVKKSGYYKSGHEI